MWLLVPVLLAVVMFSALMWRRSVRRVRELEASLRTQAKEASPPPKAMPELSSTSDTAPAPRTPPQQPASPPTSIAFTASPDLGPVISELLDNFFRNPQSTTPEDLFQGLRADHQRLHRELLDQLSDPDMQWSVSTTRTEVPRERVRTPEKSHQPVEPTKPKDPPKTWHRRLIEDE